MTRSMRTLTSGWRSTYLGFEGDFGVALEHARRGLEIAREIDHLPLADSRCRASIHPAVLSQPRARPIG